MQRDVRGRDTGTDAMAVGFEKHALLRLSLLLSFSNPLSFR